MLHDILGGSVFNTPYTLLSSPVQVSLGELLLKAFDDSTIIILLVAGTLSLGLGLATPSPGGGGNDWVEGAAILAAVAVVVGVSAGNDYQKEKQFRELSSLSEDSEVPPSALGPASVLMLLMRLLFIPGSP